MKAWRQEELRLPQANHVIDALFSIIVLSTICEVTSSSNTTAGHVKHLRLVVLVRRKEGRKEGRKSKGIKRDNQRRILWSECTFSQSMCLPNDSLSHRLEMTEADSLEWLCTFNGAALWLAGWLNLHFRRVRHFRWSPAEWWPSSRWRCPGPESQCSPRRRTTRGRPKWKGKTIVWEWWWWWFWWW